MNGWDFAIWPPGVNTTTARRPADCSCGYVHDLLAAGATTSASKFGAVEFVPRVDPNRPRWFRVETIEAEWSYTGGFSYGGDGSGSYTIISTWDVDGNLTRSFSGQHVTTGSFTENGTFYMRAHDGAWMRVGQFEDTVASLSRDYFLAGGHYSFGVRDNSQTIVEDGVEKTEFWIRNPTLVSTIPFAYNEAKKESVLSEEYTTAMLAARVQSLHVSAAARLGEVPLSWNAGSGWTLRAARGIILPSVAAAQKAAAETALTTAQQNLDNADPSLEWTYQQLLRIRDARQLALTFAEENEVDPNDSTKVRYFLNDGVTQEASTKESPDGQTITIRSLAYAHRSQIFAPWPYDSEGFTFQMQWREALINLGATSSISAFVPVEETTVAQKFALNSASPPLLRWAIITSRRTIEPPSQVGSKKIIVGLPRKATSNWAGDRRDFSAVKLGFPGYLPPPTTGDVTIYRREELASTDHNGSHWYELEVESEDDYGGTYAWIYNFDWGGEEAEFPPPELLSLPPWHIHWYRSLANPGKVLSNTEREIGDATLKLSDPWTTTEFENAIEQWVNEDFESQNAPPKLPVFNRPAPAPTGIYAYRLKSRRGRVFGVGRSRYWNLWQLPGTEWWSFEDFWTRELTITWRWKEVTRDYDTGVTSLAERSAEVTYGPGESTKYPQDWSAIAYTDLPAPGFNKMVWLTIPEAEHPRFWESGPHIEVICPTP